MIPLTKPNNCTCPYPEMIARNMNGHHFDCPAYEDRERELRMLAEMVKSGDLRPVIAPPMAIGYSLEAVLNLILVNDIKLTISGCLGKFEVTIVKNSKFRAKNHMSDAREIAAWIMTISEATCGPLTMEDQTSD